MKKHTTLWGDRGSCGSRWVLVGGFALAFGAVGCHARAMTAASVVVEEPVMEVTIVPVEIEAYPRHAYHGTYVYLVDGHWYYRSRGRWVVYTTEPRALATVRVGYEAKFGAHYRPRPEIASPPPSPKHHHKGHGDKH